MNISGTIGINGRIALSSLKKRVVLAAMRMAAHGIPLHRVDTASSLLCVAAAMFSSKRRQAFADRVETVQKVLERPDVEEFLVRKTGVLETLLDIKVYFADSGYREWGSVDRIARELQVAIAEARLRFPARPVVLSPFHYASQYVNILVCERLRIHLGMTSLSVVSAVADNVYGEDSARIPYIRRLRSYVDGQGTSLGIVREMKKNGLVILFADAPPHTLATTPMETTSVELFGKKGRIHNGIFRLGEKMNAILLPYYIKFSGGEFHLHAFDAIELDQNQAPQKLACDIEKAFVANHAQWLPSDHPSFYYFSSVK